MSELGEKYKRAEAIVLKRYEVETGNKGQSQLWKIKAIADDRKSGNDSSVLKFFVEDIEKEVDCLELVRPIIEQLCKKVCESTEKVTVEPPQAHN